MAAKDRGATPVEIAFQPMADRFMQQDAASRRRAPPAASRRAATAERLTSAMRTAFARHQPARRPRRRGNSHNQNARHAAAAALTLAILFHQHADGKTNQRTNVGGQSAIGGGDQISSYTPLRLAETSCTAGPPPGRLCLPGAEYPAFFRVILCSGSMLVYRARCSTAPRVCTLPLPVSRTMVRAARRSAPAPVC